TPWSRQRSAPSARPPESSEYASWSEPLGVTGPDGSCRSDLCLGSSCGQDQLSPVTERLPFAQRSGQKCSRFLPTQREITPSGRAVRAVFHTFLSKKRQRLSRPG